MSGKTSNKIIVLINKNPKITIPEMSKEIGITERSVERNINKLKEQALLVRIGSDKGGYWKV
jgi:ATP-dependent DNA helicase RecG